jgi:DNA-binding CsgD family transcriptional regulator
VGRANVNLANTMQNLGEIARAVEVARIGIVEDRKLGIASSYGAYLAHNLAAMLYDLGRWDEAAATSAEAFGFQHIDSALDRYGLSRLVPLLASRGDPSAETRLDQLGRLVEGKLHEGQFLGPHDLARIEFELWRGRVDAAVEIARRGVAAVSGEWLWEPNLKMVRMAARAAADLAEIGRAGRDKAAQRDAQALWDDIQAALDPFAAQLAERYHGAALAQARAELATIEAERARLTAEPQVEPWRAARDAWREFGAPYLLAYSRWRLGEALLVDGDRDTATTELREAHRLATELGAAPLRTALESLGARARIDLAPAPPSPAETAATEPSERSDPFGLTPREREVLALVSIGRTNRQIATELFISESTAGVHVSNILGKLGASTRTEAAGIAVRLGLAPSAVPAID